MTQFVHIVQVHPVENGKINLTDVTFAAKYSTKEEASAYIEWFDNKRATTKSFFKAVYLGCVNDETGELI